MLIDPLNVTDFNRGQEALEGFWLFTIFAAGKNADHAASSLAHLLRQRPEGMGPIEWLNENKIDLHNALVACRIGQYHRIEQAIIQSEGVNLRTASVGELMEIHGVGPKTARFFILHTRMGSRLAVLDTHQLAWLREHNQDVPASTPTGKRYIEIENAWLFLTDCFFPGISKAEVDLLIWARMSGRLAETPGPKE